MGPGVLGVDQLICDMNDLAVGPSATPYISVAVSIYTYKLFYRYIVQATEEDGGREEKLSTKA